MTYLNIAVPMSEIAEMDGRDFGSLIREMVYRNDEAPPAPYFVETMRSELEEADIVWLKALVEALEKEPQP